MHRSRQPDAFMMLFELNVTEDHYFIGESVI